MRALAVAAGVTGAALVDFAAGVDCDLPCLHRNEAQRCFLPPGQRPAGRVGQLIAAAGGQLVQVSDRGAIPVHRKEMRDAHFGLKISPGVFDEVAADLATPWMTATCPSARKQEVLAAFAR